MSKDGAKMDDKLVDNWKGGVSARTKVMTNWTTSWDHMANVLPIVPIEDQPKRNNSVSPKSKSAANATVKCAKIKTKENSQLLNNKNNRKKQSPKQSANHANEESDRKASPKETKRLDKSVDFDESQIRDERSREDIVRDVYRKLRKRKTATSSQTMPSTEESDPIVADSDGVDVSAERMQTESVSTETNASNVTQSSTESSIDANRSDCSSLNVISRDSMDAGRAKCVADDCNNAAVMCSMWDNQFCSTRCAVKRWTHEFRLQWCKDYEG